MGPSVPENRDVAARIARWLVGKDRPEEAVALLSAWAARGPNDGTGQSLLAEALRIDPSSKAAQQAFERMEGMTGEHDELESALLKFNAERLAELKQAAEGPTFRRAQIGFNNNVRAKQQVFHVQTEDSGLNSPHVITHLFADGGRVVKSHKRSYADAVESEPDIGSYVRKLMKAQHLEMVFALRDGHFDDVLAGKAVGGIEELTHYPEVDLSKLGPSRKASRGALDRVARAQEQTAQTDTASVGQPTDAKPGAVGGAAEERTSRPRTPKPAETDANELAKTDATNLAKTDATNLAETDANEPVATPAPVAPKTSTRATPPAAPRATPRPSPKPARPSQPARSARAPAPDESTAKKSRGKAPPPPPRARIRRRPEAPDAFARRSEAQRPAAAVKPPRLYTLHVLRSLGGGPGRYAVSRRETVIGSGGEITLPGERFCHPREARLRFREGKLELRALEGKNGVFLRINKPAVLNFGEQFIVGDQLLQVQENPVSDDAPDPDPTYFYSSPRWPSSFRVVQVLEGGARGACLVARGTTLQVGSVMGDLILGSDPLVDPQHCLVEEQAGTLILSDLDSRNGVFVRSRNPQQLVSGDEIVIGRTHLVVDIEGQ